MSLVGLLRGAARIWVFESAIWVIESAIQALEKAIQALENAIQAIWVPESAIWALELAVRALPSAVQILPFPLAIKGVEGVPVARWWPARHGILGQLGGYGSTVEHSQSRALCRQDEQTCTNGRKMYV